MINRPLILAIGLLSSISLAKAAAESEAPTPRAISGNPAAQNVQPGTGDLGHLIRLPEASGLRLGGVWLADTNYLISGGNAPGRWSWNSALIIGANLDAEQLAGWKGASFGAQFLQFNGQDTNGQAGSVQGYNSLPGPPPLDRSELYQLWYRQSLFNERLVFRIGKQVPTFDFNNVARPVATQDETLAIPAVTGLLFTPVFVQPSLLGAIGGYYNSVVGVSASFAPTENSYLRYGFYDGNVARGQQTGLRGPQFNGYYFHIGEAGVDWVIGEHYPGTFAIGGWHQTGRLDGPSGISEDGTGGFYLFGSQRLWSNASNGGTARSQPASISGFFQYGVNTSEVLPMNQSFGLGFSGFGLIPNRPTDSVGIGFSSAWLNGFPRASEQMLQAYYQAHIVGGIFLQPTLSYIPTPGAASRGSGAWAGTLRLTVLF